MAVTAFTVDDALWLMQELVFKGASMPSIRKIIEDVDFARSTSMFGRTGYPDLARRLVLDWPPLSDSALSAFWAR